MKLPSTMWIHLSLVVVLLAAAVSADCPSNPPPGSQCSCEQGVFYEGEGTRVVCRSVEDLRSMYQEIQRFRGHSVDVLKLVRIRLPFLPSGLFNGTSVKRIHLEESRLDNLYSVRESRPDTFQGLEDSLEEIRVQSTSDPSKWYWPDMRGLKRMRSVHFLMSPIDFVGHQFAEIGGGGLENVTFSHSRVYRIHPQAFPEMTNMREGNFAGNFLPYLVRTMFPNPAPRLESLNFRDNALFTLPENMFENMPALKYLDLSQNVFKTFQKVAIEPVWNQLQFFYMSSNTFNCDCSLVSLNDNLVSGSVPPHHDLHAVTCSDKGDYKKTLLKDIGSKHLQCKQ